MPNKTNGIAEGIFLINKKLLIFPIYNPQDAYIRLPVKITVRINDGFYGTCTKMRNHD